MTISTCQKPTYSPGSASALILRYIGLANYLCFTPVFETVD